MQDTHNPQIGSARAWFIWVLAAFVFFFAFIQRVSPSVMVEDLMSSFAIGATVTGTLSALYFYPYVLLQIPLGALIEQIGPRILLTVSLFIAGIGSILFSSADTIFTAYLGRILIGIGSAVGFLGSLSIAAKWFPANRFAFLSGLVLLFGMVGGIFGSAPLSIMVETTGWQNTMWYLGLLSFLFAIVIYTFIRNEPEGMKKTSVPSSSNIWVDTWSSLKEAVATREVWKVAIVASTMSAPMLTFGGLWATPYLMQAHSIHATEASTYNSMLFVGWAIGAPLAGWISDRIQKRKLLLNIGSGILSLAVAIICFVPALSIFVTGCLFIIIGFTGGCMAVCFALARENAPAHISGAVVGIVNSLTVASGAILQPVVGYILDTVWSGQQLNGVNVYLTSDYQIGFIVVFTACIIGFITSLLLNESRMMQSGN